ncbi:putative enzyme related to lactoylglutathione lyase [Lactobacillus colini]|uniref:Enzyme related to lactoylglutathione lyase n=1 Tax=Lactobacillus colini TaxID=1819254 RepID=A0ABS4MFQ3_9LACO|nr:VOC family protein [Lactobacillus colini]MBP2058521.1 putative enzyme related to lactoylglutathione lyase [Lactobacillus colini]
MHNGQVISWEIIHRNSKELGMLYSDAFGWKVLPKDGSMEYHGIITGKDSLFGAVGDPFTKDKQEWIALDIYVDDLEETINTFIKHGGKLLMPKFSTDTGFTMAYVADPVGNIFGLIDQMPDNYIEDRTDGKF